MGAAEFGRMIHKEDRRNRRERKSKTKLEGFDRGMTESV
jgi:hypothetical protein